MLSFDVLLLSVLFWGCLALSVWAFVDALVRPATGYVAAGKLTKPAWVAITAIAALLLYVIGRNGIFGLFPVIAGIVYLVDVRPAIRGLRRGNSSW